MWYLRMFIQCQYIKYHSTIRSHDCIARNRSVARGAVEGGLMMMMMMMMRRRVWDPDADARNQSGENNALQRKETVKY